jgi:hypothetical protein
MQRKLKLHILAAAATLSAMPVTANAGTFTAPEGCTLYMTVQSRACRVSNHYTCAADNPGDKWRVDFDQEGLFFRSKIDAETQWIESYDFDPPDVQTLDPAPADPASFSELLGDGRDDFAFNLSRTSGNNTSVSGYDSLTGKTFVIDGIALQETEFDFTETDPAGNITRKANGNEYVHPEWRLFFAGPGQTQFDGQMVPIDGSPLQFIFPGEPGFAATQPLFECDDVLSEGPSVPVIRVRGE